MAASLTREEAGQRAGLLTVSAYRVDLDLTGDERTFRSTSRVVFDCARPGARTFIDLAAPEVHAITLNGSAVRSGAFDGERIALDGLAARNELVIIAECAYSRSGEGLHRFADPADGAVYLYSDLEPFDARRVYACFDQPDLKARFELSVLAPEDWLVVSNEIPSNENPPNEILGTDGPRRWRFPPTPPLATYVTHVAAGPYHVTRASHRGLPLGLYCRRSLARHLDPEEIFETTRRGLDFYREAFGTEYPFRKYDQLFVPELKEGAMENAGAVTIMEAYVFRSRVTDYAREARAETILHELAHMWFGNLVTMRWWDDLWLNESFATWASMLCQAEATRWSAAWTTFAQAEKAWAYRQDQLPSTHPIAADVPGIDAIKANFDGITYVKGAAVLKQLVATVGRKEFLAGLRRYFAAHAWDNATLADLLSALERASGLDLGGWSAEWLETAGVNTLRPSYTVDASGRFTSFEILQEAPVLRSHRVGIGLYHRTGDGLTRRSYAEITVAGARTPVPDLAGTARPDLVLLNDDDLTYAKIRLDDHSLGTLTAAIGSFSSSLPAALCWAAAWDMCRDAELPARDYVRLVLRGAGSVRSLSVTQTLLNQAGTAVRWYADPAWRAEGLDLLASSLRGMLRSAAPGSDTQLSYARAFAENAASPADLALLSGLLSGQESVDGLAMDTELRWALLRRLVSAGAAGQPEIDAELLADATDAGQRHAATCRAALPTEAGKREAWELLLSGTLTIAMLRAVLDGFADPDQPELTGPYLPAYFRAIGGIWRDWGASLAQDFVAGAYQACPMDTATAAATDEYLTSADPPAALRRLLAEGRDEVLRSLRCQARDRQSQQQSILFSRTDNGGSPATRRLNPILESGIRR